MYQNVALTVRLTIYWPNCTS